MRAEITMEIASDIYRTEENVEYLVWADGSSITEQEIETDFHLESINSQIDLVHNSFDFRIEDIVLSDCHY